jgi:hypothetical protein
MLSTIRTALICALSAAFGLAPGVAQDGLYADFATSKGNFTCTGVREGATYRREFYRLATGERSWLDCRRGMSNAPPFITG